MNLSFEKYSKVCNLTNHIEYYYVLLGVSLSENHYLWADDVQQSDVFATHSIFCQGKETINLVAFIINQIKSTFGTNAKHLILRFNLLLRWICSLLSWVVIFFSSKSLLDAPTKTQNVHKTPINLFDWVIQLLVLDSHQFNYALTINLFN